MARGQRLPNIDQMDRYSQLRAHKGGLTRIKGLDVMPISLDLLNKMKKFGA